MKRLDLKNVAKLLICFGPVLCVPAYLIASYFTHSLLGGLNDEKTAFYDKAVFYEQAAIYCVTLFFAGGIRFIVGMALSSYLLARKLLFREKA